LDPSVTFYQNLTSVSFTLLGLWFGVLQFAPGEWRSDPERHRTTLHIALHFFLPGVLGLASLLGGSGAGLIWRVSFVAGGVIGLFEAIVYLSAWRPVLGFGSRLLRVISPVLWALVVIAAFLPRLSLDISSLQLEGMAVGLIFVCGLCYVWLVFAERMSPADDQQPANHNR
jgi:hypothetical protein